VQISRLNSELLQYSFPRPNTVWHFVSNQHLMLWCCRSQTVKWIQLSQNRIRWRKFVMMLRNLTFH